MRSSARTGNCTDDPEGGLIIDEFILEMPPAPCLRGRLSGGEDLGRRITWQAYNQYGGDFGGRSRLDENQEFCLQAPAPGKLWISRQVTQGKTMRTTEKVIRIPYAAKQAGRSCMTERDRCHDLGTIELPAPKTVDANNACKRKHERVILLDRREYIGCVIRDQNDELMIRTSYGTIFVPRTLVKEIQIF